MKTSVVHRLFGQASQRGFALLEVMMALFIFTMVAFSLILALDAAFNAERQRMEIDAAIRGIGNQLVQLRATPVTPMDRDQPDDGSGVIYHVTIEQEQLRDQKKQPVTGIYRVTVTAKWKSNGAPNDRSVSELVYQP